MYFFPYPALHTRYTHPLPYGRGRGYYGVMLCAINDLGVFLVILKSDTPDTPQFLGAK